MKTAIIILLTLLSAASTAAQNQLKASVENLQQSKGKPPLAPPPSQDGIWPTPKLINSLLLRWTAQVGQQYALDDAQHELVQQAILKRWPPFLQENRSKIQPLINQFLEMRMAMTPPPKEAVQEWAKHAQPILDVISQQIIEGAGDVRSVLTPDQRITFDAEQLKLAVGMQLARTKVQAWEKGDFEPDELWQSTPTSLQKAANDPARDETSPTSVLPNMDTTTPPDQITRELSAWEDFVTNFIKRYALNDSQKDAARSILSEMKQRAITHRDRNREAIDALEVSIRQNSGSEKELAAIRENLVSLYGPIDNMFETLRRRIRAIPTKNQQQTVSPNGQ